MQKAENTWPEEAQAALGRARAETEAAGCGGCKHADWAGTVTSPFAKEPDKKQFRFAVAICGAGVQLGTNSSDGLLKAVAYCTARNRPIGALPTRAHEQQISPPTVRPTLLGLKR